MNRFYSAFYKKLLDPQIGVGNKRAIFLNLLYRVLRNDHSVIRLKAFIKRIFQIILYYPANMACATLYVVSQVLKSKKDAHKIMSCFKADVKVEKEEKKENKKGKIENEGKKKESEEEKTESEEEKISSTDSESSEEENEITENDNIVISNVITETTKIITKISEEDIKEEPMIKEEFDPEKEYNPFCRNPLGSGANNSFYYELVALINHFHPSVALFASNIKEGDNLLINF